MCRSGCPTCKTKPSKQSSPGLAGPLGTERTKKAKWHMPILEVPIIRQSVRPTPAKYVPIHYAGTSQKTTTKAGMPPPVAVPARISIGEGDLDHVVTYNRLKGSMIQRSTGSPTAHNFERPLTTASNSTWQVEGKYQSYRSKWNRKQATPSKGKEAGKARDS